VKRGSRRENLRDGNVRKTQVNIAGFEEEGKVSLAKQCEQPLKAEKSRKMSSFFRASSKKYSPIHLDFSSGDPF
jgi:hypothetical protein